MVDTKQLSSPLQLATYALTTEFAHFLFEAEICTVSANAEPVVPANIKKAVSTEAIRVYICIIEKNY